MSARNYDELGINLQKIVSRLMANDRLINLLYYTDKDPLSQEPLTSKQKDDYIFEKLIKIVPKIGSKENAKSLLAIRVERADTISSNTEFVAIKIAVEVFVPLTQWLIKDSNLRPFAIMGEIQKSLNNKTINGLGKIKGGDFELNFLTEEMSCYEQTFIITEYE